MTLLLLIGCTFLPIIGHLAVAYFFGLHALGLVVVWQIVLGILFG